MGKSEADKENVASTSLIKTRLVYETQTLKQKMRKHKIWTSNSRQSCCKHPAASDEKSWYDENTQRSQENSKSSQKLDDVNADEVWLQTLQKTQHLKKSWAMDARRSGSRR